MAVGRWLNLLGSLLRPWLVLAPAVLVLSLVQGIAAHAPWAVLGQHAIADALKAAAAHEQQAAAVLRAVLQSLVD